MACQPIYNNFMPRGNNIHITFICTFTSLYDIKQFYLLQIICTQLYGFKYSYQILIIMRFQVIIFIA